MLLSKEIDVVSETLLPKIVLKNFHAFSKQIECLISNVKQKCLT